MSMKTTKHPGINLPRGERNRRFLVGEKDDSMPMQAEDRSSAY